MKTSDDEAYESSRGLLRQILLGLKRRGASIQSVSLPHTKLSLPAYCIIASAEASSSMSRYDGVRYGPTLPLSDKVLAPSSTPFSSWRSSMLGSEVKRRILLGTFALSAKFVALHVSCFVLKRAVIVISGIIIFGLNRFANKYRVIMMQSLVSEITFEHRLLSRACRIMAYIFLCIRPPLGQRLRYRSRPKNHKI